MSYMATTAFFYRNKKRGLWQSEYFNRFAAILSFIHIFYFSNPAGNTTIRIHLKSSLSYTACVILAGIKSASPVCPSSLYALAILFYLIHHPCPIYRTGSESDL